MANVKITDLPSLTGASSASVDVLPVVNIAGDATSKMTRAEFFKNVPAIDLVGAITTGSWNGATITAPYGGTGITSYTIGDLVYASTTIALSKLPDVATGNVLISGGVGVAPSYGKVGLTTHVSDVLPLANGGTGLNTVSTAGVYAALLGYTATATAAGTTVLTNTSTQYQLFTGSTTQTITLPVTSTLTTGWTFHIVNNSSGNLTVNSSGANLVTTIYPNMTVMVTCIATTTTTAADWEYGYTDFGGVSGTGNVVLASGPTITGAALNGTVGATTPSTGAFTTLSASSTVSGTGFSTYLSSPPAIGNTAANTGAFTTLSASSTVSGTGFSTYLASPPAIGGTTAAAVTGAPIASTSVVTSGFTTLTAGTIALAFASKGVVQVTPNATGSFTSTVPPAGTRCTLIVLTSGTTSYTMTFGTGFKTAGTLATGTVTAKTFVFQFVSDGTTLIEASRTTAL